MRITKFERDTLRAIYADLQAMATLFYNIGDHQRHTRYLAKAMIIKGIMERT